MLITNSWGGYSTNQIWKEDGLNSFSDNLRKEVSKLGKEVTPYGE